MGRPREKHKDLPNGVRLISGRFYVYPVNDEMRRIFAAIFPGKASAPLGADKDEMRKRWVKIFIGGDAVPGTPGSDGTVLELIERWQREFGPQQVGHTKDERERYCEALKVAFGSRRYAKYAEDAAIGGCLRTVELTRYLRTEAKRRVFHADGRLLADGRPVAANREVEFLSRIFSLAKSEWGLTEYNPCLGLTYNKERAREHYQDDVAFMKVYECATPIVQCMMDLAQMNGSRRGMLMRMTLGDITPEGLWTTLNKREVGAIPKRKMAPWSSELREVVDRILMLRAKVRKARGLTEVAELPSAPLFLTRKGLPFGDSAINTAFQKARRKAGFKRHEFHFHDIKAKALSDSPDLADAQQRGDHSSPVITEIVYRRKPKVVAPLKRVSKGKE